MGVWVRIDGGMDGWVSGKWVMESLGSGQWTRELVGIGGSFMGVYEPRDGGMDG